MGKQARVKALAIVAEPLKLDFGCGPNKRAGFHGVDAIAFPGVDTVLDVRQPWPWADGSIGEAHASHFLEHLTGPERVTFMNALCRVLKVGATATIIVPHWTNACAYGDSTHQWPPMSEWAPLYWNKAWRDGNAPHTGFTCDFDFVTGFGFDERVMNWNQDRKMFALSHHLNAARDMHITLTKRP